MKIRRNLTHLLLLILLPLLLLQACGNSTGNDTEEPQETELFELGTVVDNNITITAWTVQPPETGYQEIYLTTASSGEPMGQQVRFTPMMQMEGHAHAAPYGTEADGAGLQDPDQEGYAGWVIFTMPGGWMLQLAVQGSEGSPLAEGTITFEVEDSGRAKSFVDSEDNRYHLTLIEPLDPETGENELVIALHQAVSATEFPPTESATMEVEPWMPSMDHGSSGNSHPVHDESGFYRGVVNFNMTGDWEIRLEVSLEGSEPVEQVFELTF